MRRRLSDTVKISQSIKAAIVQTSPLPFELKVLEALLSGEAHAAGHVKMRRWRPYGTERRLHAAPVQPNTRGASEHTPHEQPAPSPSRVQRRRGRTPTRASGWPSWRRRCSQT